MICVEWSNCGFIPIDLVDEINEAKVIVAKECRNIRNLDNNLSIEDLDLDIYKKVSQ